MRAAALILVGFSLSPLLAERCGAQPSSPRLDPSGAAPLSDPAASVSELPLQSLLERLPKAGCEWRYDRSIGRGVEDPASAELRRRLLSGTELSEDQWRYVIIKTGALMVRENWPSGTPFAVWMTVPRWLDIAQIRAVPNLPGLGPAQAGELSWGFSGTGPLIRDRNARYQELGPLPPRLTALVFDVTVERGRGLAIGMAAPPPGMLWRGKVQFQVSPVATLDEAVPPVSGAELDEALRQSIGAGVRRWGSDTFYVVVDPDTDRFPALRDTGLSLNVEVLRDGKVTENVPLLAARLDPLAVANSLSSAALRFYDSGNLTSIPADVAEDPGALQRWELRISGVSQYVLFLWDAKARWGGTLTIPLAEAIARERERAGAGGRGPEISTPHFRR